MKLAELINLEYRLMQDGEKDPVTLQHRDRAIGRTVDAAPDDRRALFLAWLDRVRIESDQDFGATVARWFSRLRIILFVAGLLAGAGAARGVLAYDGSSPVNIVHFLAVFVGVQGIFLLLALLHVLPPAVKDKIPGKDEILLFVRETSFLFSRLLDRIAQKVPREKTDSVHAALARLKQRHQLYRRLEEWLLIGLTQRFAIAFSTGALITCLYLIVFSDLAFAWNTTLQIENRQFHNVVRTLAAPWELVTPQAVPSLELVESTRYFRIEGEYQAPAAGGRSAEPAAVGGWWPFLVMSLLVYGFLPRAALLAFSGWRVKRLLLQMPLSGGDFDALHERLTLPVVETRATEKELPPLESKAAPVGDAGTRIAATACDAVLWGELALPAPRAEELIADRFDMRVENRFEAGGFDAAGDDKLPRLLGENGSSERPVLILAESWEAPSRAVLRFIQALRASVGEGRPIVVALLEPGGNGTVHPPSEADWATWKQAMGGLSDPWLRLAALVEPA